MDHNMGKTKKEEKEGRRKWTKEKKVNKSWRGRRKHTQGRERMQEREGKRQRVHCVYVKRKEWSWLGIARKERKAVVGIVLLAWLWVLFQKGCSVLDAGIKHRNLFWLRKRKSNRSFYLLLLNIIIIIYLYYCSWKVSRKIGV